MHIVTPLIESAPLTARLGVKVLLKLDALQPSGSFKLRGIGRLATELVKKGATHLFSSSGGNAGLAVAYAGRRLGVPVTVIVPSRTSEEIRTLIRGEGATVEVHGEVWDEAHAFAFEAARATGGGYVHPFDDPTLWEGHSSLIDELVSADVNPQAILLSVGGGGLFVGVVEGLMRHRMNDVSVIAVETHGAASFAAALAAGRVVTLERIETIATTLGARAVAPRALACAKTHPTYSIQVTDAAALAACVRLSDDHRLLVEPACGAALAPAYEAHATLTARIDPALGRPVVVIVCGGVGVSAEAIGRWRDMLLPSA